MHGDVGADGFGGVMRDGALRRQLISTEIIDSV